MSQLNIILEIKLLHGLFTKDTNEFFDIRYQDFIH